MALIYLINFLSLLLLTSQVFSKSICEESNDCEASTCGYSSCPVPKKGFLNVHIISHTHDDVGWLKTVDQYYYGSKPNIQVAGVQYILDSVIQVLKHDPSKRFIYVETAFFWKWWQKQSDHERHIVKRLVSNGQLEFIGGGWSMHDEATTHYHSIIDQMTWGFRKLNDTFGKCGVPRVGWQIDPFGHSRESASIMARLGFDGLLVGRVDYMDKTTRMLHKNLEMIWEASPNLGREADLFTGILFNTYSAPSGFCFDIMCRDEPIIDDKHSPDYNADKRAAEFLRFVTHQTDSYKSRNNIALTMGGDFNYLDAHYYLVNLDRLIRAVNSRQETHNSNVNLMYSTPSCYLKALNSEGLQWPTKQDDFFPYSSDPRSFWSGFYTSRPNLKRFERIGNNFLQVCKQLYSMTNLGPEDKGNLNIMREAMGILQHHDAVSGTEKQHVASDYARQLNIGFDECSMITETALSKLMVKSPTSVSEPLALTSCLLLNISQCDISETHNTFVITLYNPLSRSVPRYVRLPVAGNGHAYTVSDPQGKPLPLQIVPVPEPVTKIPGRTSEATVELVFYVVLPAFGFRSFFVSPSNSVVTPHLAPVKTMDRDFTIGHSNSVRVTFDGLTKLPSRLHVPGLTDPPSFQQNFYYYLSASGNNEEPKNRSSGAYIFRPNSSYIMVNPQPSVKYYRGPLVEEVHLQYSSWVSQVIRAYHKENHIEFDWVVGPIPVSDNIGKELVSRYKVYNMVNNGTFYTDSNGREMLKRELNKRPTYNWTLEEPISGNYYPVTTRMSLRNDKWQMSIITDRSQGGSSLRDGEMELMLHRRMLHDDGFGVDEALNEEAFGRGLVARGSHYLTGGAVGKQDAVDRKLVQEKVLSVWTFLTPTTLTLAEWQTAYHMEFSGLNAALPDSVQILTLEPWKDTSFLLRLEHILEKGDGLEAKSVNINLQEIFKPFTITWVRETTLGANQWLDEVSRLVWKKEDNHVDNNETVSSTRPQDVPIVSLQPMDIKSFVIQVEFKCSHCS